MPQISLAQLAGSVRKFNLNRPFICPILGPLFIFRCLHVDLLRIDYEKIPPSTSIIYWGDYPQHIVVNVATIVNMQDDAALR